MVEYLLLVSTDQPTFEEISNSIFYAVELEGNTFIEINRDFLASIVSSDVHPSRADILTREQKLTIFKMFMLLEELMEFRLF